MTFGETIARARKDLGVSQRELAMRIVKEDGAPISPQYLNDIERDRRNPPGDHLLEQLAQGARPGQGFPILSGREVPVRHARRLQESEAGRRGVQGLQAQAGRQPMKWVRDRSRRFEQRPYYAQYELDAQCEQTVEGFLKGRSGSAAYPLTTDDLTVMIERDVAELDLYASLAGEGAGVEGVTEFRPREKPTVRIARYLSESPARENRLRSTLAHEYAHVLFHGFLWGLQDHVRKPGFVQPHYRRCRRSRVVSAPEGDWMEWQAGYGGGALLMPLTPLREVVESALYRWRDGRMVRAGTDRHSELVERVAAAFAVSKDAAGVRLMKLGYAVPAEAQPA